MIQLSTITDYYVETEILENVLLNSTNNLISAYLFKQDVIGKKKEGKIHLYNCLGNFNPGNVKLHIHPNGKYLFIANGFPTGYKCTPYKGDKDHLSFSSTNEILKLKETNGGSTHKTLKLDPKYNTIFGFTLNQEVLIVLLDSHIGKQPIIEKNIDVLDTSPIIESIKNLKESLDVFSESIRRK